MEKQQSSYKEKERTDLREPRRYKVIMYNDDFTVMEFVVEVLATVFHKSAAEAEAIMLEAHQKRTALVGIYSYDIAMTRVQKAIRMARGTGYPLRFSMSPTEE